MPNLDRNSSPDYREYVRWRVRADAEMKVGGIELPADITMQILFEQGLTPSQAVYEIRRMRENTNGTTEKT